MIFSPVLLHSSFTCNTKTTRSRDAATLWSGLGFDSSVEELTFGPWSAESNPKSSFFNLTAAYQGRWCGGETHWESSGLGVAHENPVVVWNHP